MIDQPQSVPVLQVPVEGTWRIVRSPGHEEFAYDLAAVDSTRSRTLRKSFLRHAVTGVAAENSYGWERIVHAPIGGTVVMASDGQRDRKRLHLLRDLGSVAVSLLRVGARDIRPFAGNFVILQGEGCYVFLAHLRRRSVRVREGARVDAGDVLGQVGNSGVSLQPHLHIQLFDQIDDIESADAPAFVLDRYDRWSTEGWIPVRKQPLRKGDVVRFPEP